MTIVRRYDDRNSGRCQYRPRLKINVSISIDHEHLRLSAPDQDQTILYSLKPDQVDRMPNSEHHFLKLSPSSSYVLSMTITRIKHTLSSISSTP